MGWLQDAWYSPRQFKREAVEYWPQQAGREYELGHALWKHPGAAAKLLGALHMENALAYYGAGAAAELASESVGGWALDALSAGKGKLASAAVAAAAKQIGRLVSPASRAGQALVTTTKLAQQWSAPGSAALLGRKAVKLGTLGGRGFGGAASESAGGAADLAPGWQLPHREPLHQASLDIHPELPKARPPMRPPRPRQPALWSPSYVDPVKLAAARLRDSRPAPYQPLGGPFSSTLDKLRELEQRSVDHERTQAWLRGVNRDLERGIRTPDIFDRRALEPHRQPAPQPLRSRPPVAPGAASGSYHRPLSWYAQGLR